MKHRIQLSLFLLLLTASAFAQEITVKNFGQATQFIAASDQIRDWDNELCALVKIQGAKIDSISGAFEVRKLGSEVWVYMTDGDRKLTIHKQGYEPKEVVFKNYGIDNVKSNKVYLMTIFAPELTKKRLFIGIEGGINFSDARDMGAVYVGSVSMFTGFHIGINATYMFTDLFGASVGMYFFNKGYKYTDNNYILEETGKFQFFEVPVQANVRFNLSEAIMLQLNAGPYFSINVGGKTSAKDGTSEKFSDKFSSFQMGGQAGLKLIFAKHYTIGADYQSGFGNYKNQNISINVGYLF